jgi:hypothetical protein
MRLPESLPFIQPFYLVYWIRQNSGQLDWDTFIRSITPKDFLTVLEQHPFDVLDAVFIHQKAIGPCDEETYSLETFFKIWKKPNGTFEVHSGECRLAKYDEIETETWEISERFLVGNLKEIAETIYSRFIDDVC